MNIYDGTDGGRAVSFTPDRGYTVKIIVSKEGTPVEPVTYAVIGWALIEFAEHQYSSLMPVIIDDDGRPAGADYAAADLSGYDGRTTEWVVYRDAR